MSNQAYLTTSCSFYKRKVSYIKRTCEILQRDYDSDIPATVDDLCKLPGVGPKMAYLCMNIAWNANAGIGGNSVYE